MLIRHAIRRVHSVTQTAGSAGQGLPTEVLGRLRHSIDHQIKSFREIYCRDESDLRGLQEWIQSYYRRPRPDLLLGAWAVASKIPGAFSG